MIPVVWLNYHPEICHSPGMWDQNWIQETLNCRLFSPPKSFEFQQAIMVAGDPVWPDSPGIVLIVPGRFHEYEAKRISLDIARYQWVLMIITSDEERLFPWWEVQHPRMMVWCQTPKREQDFAADNCFGYGASPNTLDILGTMDHNGYRPHDFFFSGQVTHSRRDEMIEVFERRRSEFHGVLNSTAGFTQGLDKAAYLRGLTQCRAALAPSGPQTVDSFRLWEALEAGAVPLADGALPGGLLHPTYWNSINQLPNERLPFPVVTDWKEGPHLVESVSRHYPGIGLVAQSWLGRTKRAFAHRLHEDIATLGAARPDPEHADDEITVLIPTSYSPHHPSTDMLWRTISSVRKYLPTAEILIMMDGNNGSHAYHEYQRRVINAVTYGWGTFNISVKVFTDGYHQSGMTRWALQNFVKTPFLLFVEHDTPLTVGPGKGVDFNEVLGAMKMGHLDYLRFHYQTKLHPEHAHLMLGERTLAGLPVTMTRQWSQRPHISPTAFYEKILDTVFEPDERIFIEERMHSVADIEAWPMSLAIYTPSGDIERSYHLDGRMTGSN